MITLFNTSIKSAKVIDESALQILIKSTDFRHFNDGKTFNSFKLLLESTGPDSAQLVAISGQNEITLIEDVEVEGWWGEVDSLLKEVAILNGDA